MIDSCNPKEGHSAINGRIVLASVIIKYMLDLTDRETIQQIGENMFMPYFLGYSSFTNETPFDPSLFVDIRERLSLDIMNKITELVLKHNIETFNTNEQAALKEANNEDNQKNEPSTPITQEPKRTLLMDATVSPQNITYPTDLKVLYSSRIKSEKIINLLYTKELHRQTKVRT